MVGEADKVKSSVILNGINYFNITISYHILTLVKRTVVI